MPEPTIVYPHQEQAYSEVFIRDQFHIIETEGRTLTACGDYWNQGTCGIAVALCFENDPTEGVYAWKAYLGATVHPNTRVDPAYPDSLMTTEEATLHARKHGVKLSEGEARRILAQYADTLGTLRYWR